ncbi:hypothetical protein NEIMUCOT_06231 [Neisseria mucosa ATCC 25996]|uniref:Uncharacterized protein n=1 Tax=Neisseria mucosa (strain ATCC 25996 / DSM 4631 / NCTC 10774 / M26) TaxID=546266 RepID=D2ZZZ7_NEIM2|nr:hypothetical protein NEIMUCOT_06231 [Neisseria mucosa ATCC 25996]
MGFAHEMNNRHSFPIRVVRRRISWAKPTLLELSQTRVDWIKGRLKTSMNGFL